MLALHTCTSSSAQSALQALSSDRDREELFLDHMKERDRKERESRKVEQKRRQAQFRVLLENSSFIKVGMLMLVC